MYILCHVGKQGDFIDNKIRLYVYISMDINQEGIECMFITKEDLYIDIGL